MNQKWTAPAEIALVRTVASAVEAVVGTLGIARRARVDRAAARHFQNSNLEHAPYEVLAGC